MVNSRKIDLSSIKYRKDLTDDLLDKSSVKTPKVKSKKSAESLPEQLVSNPRFATKEGLALRVKPPSLNNITDQILKNALDKERDKPVIIENKPVTEPKNDVVNQLNATERRRLILGLQMYFNECPDRLKAFKDMDFEKMSDEKLSEIKNEMDFVLGAKCNIRTTQSMCLQGIGLLETVCVNFTPLKVEGLTNMLADDEELKEDVKHLALRYMSIVKTDPEMRISLKIMTSMLTLHNHNSSIPKVVDLNAINNVNNKYTNL